MLFIFLFHSYPWCHRLHNSLRKISKYLETMKLITINITYGSNQHTTSIQLHNKFDSLWTKIGYNKKIDILQDHHASLLFM